MARIDGEGLEREGTATGLYCQSDVCYVGLAGANTDGSLPPLSQPPTGSSSDRWVLYRSLFTDGAYPMNGFGLAHLACRLGDEGETGEWTGRH